MTEFNETVLAPLLEYKAAMEKELGEELPLECQPIKHMSHYQRICYRIATHCDYNISVMERKWEQRVGGPPGSSKDTEALCDTNSISHLHIDAIRHGAP